MSEKIVELETLARRHLAVLECRECGSNDYATNGMSEGRLRLKCRSCNKSCYAYKHPDVLSRFSNGDPGQPIALSQTTLRAVPQPKHPTVLSQPASKTQEFIQDMDMDSSLTMEEEMTNMEMWNAITPEQRIEYLFATTEENTMTIEEMKTSTGEIKKEVKTLQALIMRTLERLESLNAQLHANASSPPAKTNVPVPQTPSRPQLPLIEAPWSTNHQQPLMEAPWKTAVTRGLRQVTAPLEPRIASQNRFAELQHSIPSYQRMTYEEYERNVPNIQRPPRQRQNKIQGNLTKDQIMNVKNGHSSRPISPMVILYFSAAKRNRITEIKSMLKSIGIPLHWIRNIGFIGRSVMELTTFEDRQQDIISKLENYEILIIENFDPLSIDNLKDDRKYSGLTEAQKKEAAARLHRTRLLKTLDRLPKTPINNRLRNFFTFTLKNTELPTNDQVQPIHDLTQAVPNSPHDMPIQSSNTVQNQSTYTLDNECPVANGKRAFSSDSEILQSSEDDDTNTMSDAME